MQIRCPQCKALLEIPEPSSDTSLFHVECGACKRRFKLQLNRPSLKVRRPVSTGQWAKRADDPELAELQKISLTAASGLEGREVVREIGSVTCSVTLSISDEERQAQMLDNLSLAQDNLRREARTLGADGVIGVKMDTLEDRELPILRLRGMAVELRSLVSPSAG